jgi:hypothetical protein
LGGKAAVKCEGSAIMAKRIYLESRNAAFNGSTFGHLYLVYREEGALPVDAGPLADKVIMGTSLEMGARLGVFSDVAIGLTDDRYNDATPQSRYSLDITNFIPGAGLSGGVAEAWQVMAAVARGINSSRYDYELPDGLINHTANSGAVILSVLNAVGVDIRELPTHDGQLGSYLESTFTNRFPGASNTSEPTLLGEAGNVYIYASDKQKSGLILLGRDDVDDIMVGTKFEDRYYGEQIARFSVTHDIVSYNRVATELGLVGGLTVSFKSGSLSWLPLSGPTSAPVEVFGVNAFPSGALAPNLSDILLTRQNPKILV